MEININNNLFRLMAKNFLHLQPEGVAQPLLRGRGFTRIAR